MILAKSGSCTRRRAVALALSAALSMGTAGCKKKPPVAPAEVVPEDALLSTLRARQLPDPAQARFSVKIRSKSLGIAAPPLGGGLVVDRPGRAYLAVMNPVGGPVLTVTSDGQGVALMNARDKQWVLSDDAATLLGGATDGALSLDDLVGLLLGAVPLTDDGVTGREEVELGVRFDADGPGGTALGVTLDPVQATPREIVVHTPGGARLVTATYEPFEPLAEGGPLLPTRVQLELTDPELSIGLRYKSWQALDEAPDVFGLVPPVGFTVLTMDEYVALMKAADPDVEDGGEPEETPTP